MWTWIVSGRSEPHSVEMDHELETRALREVQKRLTQRFPHVEVEVVEAAVRVAYSKLTGLVRDFASVLVEHEARERLAQMVDSSSPPSQRHLVRG